MSVRKSLLPFALLWAFFTGAAQAVGANPLPERYTAEYTMHAYGAVVGRAKTALSAVSESERVYEQSSWPAGLAKLFVSHTLYERTQWTLHEGSPRPQRYERKREGRKSRTTHLEFDWTKRQLSGERKGVRVSAPLRDGTHDRMTYVLAMMIELAAGKTDLSYTVTDGSKTKTYRFTAPKPVQLETALGTLSTLEIRRVRESGERETTYWFAPELHYIPVQIEHREKGEHVVARIESIEW